MTITADTNTWTTVKAEDAPVGVTLWACREGTEMAWTLAEVQTVRDSASTFVRWVYQSGKERVFSLGEGVAVMLPVEDEDEEEDFGCPGHESLSGAHMGEAVYCDGSCSGPRR